jgi:folate-binding protein YgfZ
MVRTALYDKLAASGARLGEYRGVETAARFSDPSQELNALRSGCALSDLGWQARMTVTGEDRQRWLNGMVTNNIRDLQGNRGVYCFLLTAQGRIQGDMHVYNRGDRMFIDTDYSQAEKLREAFERFIIMDDVELTVPEARRALGVAGPRAQQTLRAVGLDVPNMAPLQLKLFEGAESEIEIICKSAGEHASYELSSTPTTLDMLWNRLRESGATPVGFEALELWRVARGIPRYGQDISERYLPHETEQMQALHFSKGCYVGQEIVERVRSRGQVHRRLTGFTVADIEAEVAPGAKIQRDGKDVGEITSVASLPSHNGTAAKKVALGYIRREVGSPGNEVLVNGAKAYVTNLPFE